MRNEIMLRTNSQPPSPSHPLVARSEQFAAAEGARRAMTRQGSFEASFLSLDHPDANGAPRDYGDCGRAAKRMLSRLDAPFRERLREHRFQAAIWKLRDYPELQKTLRAIRRYRKREKIFSALQIKAGTYRERFSQLTQILKISI